MGLIPARLFLLQASQEVFKIYSCLKVKNLLFNLINDLLSLSFLYSCLCGTSKVRPKSSSYCNFSHMQINADRFHVNRYG